MKKGLLIVPFLFTASLVGCTNEDMDQKVQSLEEEKAAIRSQLEDSEKELKKAQTEVETLTTSIEKNSEGVDKVIELEQLVEAYKIQNQALELATSSSNLKTLVAYEGYYGNAKDSFIPVEIKVSENSELNLHEQLLKLTLDINYHSFKISENGKAITIDFIGEELDPHLVASSAITNFSVVLTHSFFTSFPNLEEIYVLSDGTGYTTGNHDVPRTEPYTREQLETPSEHDNYEILDKITL